MSKPKIKKLKKKFVEVLYLFKLNFFFFELLSLSQPDEEIKKNITRQRITGNLATRTNHSPF